MKIEITGAERTNKLTSVALKLINGKTVIVGNTIINKVLTNDDLNFSSFRALCAVGGYHLDIEGTVVSHVAKEVHENGTYASDGFHLELDDDTFPTIELSNSPIAIGLMFQLGNDRVPHLLSVASKSPQSGAPKMEPNTEFDNASSVVDSTEASVETPVEEPVTAAQETAKPTKAKKS